MAVDVEMSEKQAVLLERRKVETFMQRYLNSAYTGQREKTETISTSRSGAWPSIVSGSDCAAMVSGPLCEVHFFLCT